MCACAHAVQCSAHVHNVQIAAKQLHIILYHMHTLKCIAHFFAQTALDSCWDSSYFWQTTVFAAKDFSETPSAPVLTWNFKGILTSGHWPHLHPLDLDMHIMHCTLEVIYARRDCPEQWTCWGVVCLTPILPLTSTLCTTRHCSAPTLSISSMYWSLYICNGTCVLDALHILHTFIFCIVGDTLYSGGLYAGLCAAVVSDLRSTG